MVNIYILCFFKDIKFFREIIFHEILEIFVKLLVSRKKKNIAFTLVLYYHSSSTSAESDHESATGASASANTRGQRRFVFSAKKSSQRGDFQQHPCKEIFFCFSNEMLVA